MDGSAGRKGGWGRAMASYTRVQVNHLPTEVRLAVERALLGPLAPFPVDAVRGTESGRGVTHLVRGDTQVIRRRNPNPRDPHSETQLLQRAQWTLAKRHWATL